MSGKEIVFTWRGIIILLAIFLGYLLTPTFFVWIGLAVFLLFVLHKLWIYTHGYGFIKTPTVIFAGFYSMSQPVGKFTRNGNTSVLDAKFFARFQKSLTEHQAQSTINLQTRFLKPPKIVHARYTYDTFEKLTNKYVDKNLAVLWGTIDENGKIEHFEVTVPKNVYEPGDALANYTEDLKRVLSLKDINQKDSLEFLADMLAVAFNSTFCDALISKGLWKDSLWIASHSRATAENAIKKLENSAGEESVKLAKFEAERMLPTYIRLEALALGRADNWDDALEKMLEGVEINPYHPFYNETEFAKHYNDRYALDLSESGLIDISPKINDADKFAKLTELSPSIQLFADWICKTTPEMIEDLDKKIDIWFERLVKKHPNNPFIYLYWADLIGYAYRYKQMQIKGKKKPSKKVEEIDLLPLEIVDAKIEKCKEALKFAPNSSVIGSKLAILYFLSFPFVEGSELKRRQSEMASYKRKHRAYFLDYFPDKVKPEIKSSLRRRTPYQRKYQVIYFKRPKTT